MFRSALITAFFLSVTFSVHAEEKKSRTFWPPGETEKDKPQGKGEANVRLGREFSNRLVRVHEDWPQLHKVLRVTFHYLEHGEGKSVPRPQNEEYINLKLWYDHPFSIRHIIMNDDRVEKLRGNFMQLVEKRHGALHAVQRADSSTMPEAKERLGEIDEEIEKIVVELGRDGLKIPYRDGRFHFTEKKPDEAPEVILRRGLLLYEHLNGEDYMTARKYLPFLSY